MKIKVVKKGAQKPKPAGGCPWFIDNPPDQAR
jgi:hypothetical protein